jgi:hypothetical protein
MQHAATQYNMLQHSTTSCNTVQQAATQYNMLPVPYVEHRWSERTAATMLMRSAQADAAP